MSTPRSPPRAPPGTAGRRGPCLSGRDSAPLRNVARAKLEPFADLIARETASRFGKRARGRGGDQQGRHLGVLLRRTHLAKALRRGDGRARRGPPQAARRARRARPYNFRPIAQRSHRPALLAGNAIVFKPSEKTPAVGEYLVLALPRGRVPEGGARCVQGGIEVARRSPPIRVWTASCSPARPGPGSRSIANSPTPRTSSSPSKWAATTRSSSGRRATSTPPPRSPSSRPI